MGNQRLNEPLSRPYFWVGVGWPVINESLNRPIRRELEASWNIFLTSPSHFSLFGLRFGGRKVKQHCILMSWSISHFFGGAGEKHMMCILIFVYICQLWCGMQVAPPTKWQVKLYFGILHSKCNNPGGDMWWLANILGGVNSYPHIVYIICI